MQLLIRELKNWALQVNVAKDNNILGDALIGSVGHSELDHLSASSVDPKEFFLK